MRYVCVAVVVLVCMAGQERLAAQALSDQDAKCLAAIRAQEPTIAAAIENDPGLRADLGAEAFSRALSEVAWVCESADTDCQVALSILGDTVPRVKAAVPPVKIDGNPREWAGTVPPPDSVRFEGSTPDHSRDFWAKGAAAVVRDDRLYFMLGITDSAYFERKTAEIHIYVDCIGGTQWDTRLALTRRDGKWKLVANFWPKDGQPAPQPAEVTGLQVATGEVIEFVCDTADFAPPSVAKPIWAVSVFARTDDGGGKGEMWPRLEDFAVFNETAQPGVAAPTYVRNLMLLAADAGLRDMTRTALAIAITSAILCELGDRSVLPQVRRDNAERLLLAREVSAWQTRLGLKYNLARYPLEAQLTWGDYWQNGTWYGACRGPLDRLPDMENYRWGTLTAETARGLRQLAEDRGMVAPLATETAERVDKWLNSTGRGDETEDPVIGTLHGMPMTLAGSRIPASYLRSVLTTGHWHGRCGPHGEFAVSLLISVGIASHRFGVAPLQEGLPDHVWAGYYDPAANVWRSYQIGRGDDALWAFNWCGRVPVYSYACMAPCLKFWKRLGETPLPFFFRMEITGRQIKALTQGGIPTRVVREWMLTPCFGP